MDSETARVGRPRSEHAKAAVLHAVDDLLLEVGYSAMTMKGIAERAEVGRQTVYRWWSTKAEILFEASVIDARQELAVTLTADPLRDLVTYLDALVEFLARSPAGAAYRALLGEAQHDRVVADLIATHDVVSVSAAPVVQHAIGPATRVDRAVALLVGPVFFWIVNGHDPAEIDTADAAAVFLRAATSLRTATVKQKPSKVGAARMEP